MQEEQTGTTIPEMVDDVRAGKMPRRNFMKALTAMGVTAAGAGVITTVAASPAFTKKPQVVTHADEHAARNLQLHDQHLSLQNQGDIQQLKHDYAHDAIVEDSMSEKAFVGHAAILARKGSSIAAIPDLQIAVTNRVAQGAQVMIEWLATGTHNGDLFGLAASGRQFSIRGVTVVVRKDDKIAREALYYDVAEVRRQLGI
ncbi:MAG: hypothetical protein NVSMB49_06680 [Ktedonobacteraceae bacterium]